MGIYQKVYITVVTEFAPLTFDEFTFVTKPTKATEKLFNQQNLKAKPTVGDFHAYVSLFVRVFKDLPRPYPKIGVLGYLNNDAVTFTTPSDGIFDLEELLGKVGEFGDGEYAKELELKLEFNVFLFLFFFY